MYKIFRMVGNSGTNFKIATCPWEVIISCPFRTVTPLLMTISFYQREITCNKQQN